MATIQIRNVPDELHRELKSRAARSGQSLSEYALGELLKVGSAPTIDELFERARARGSGSAATETVVEIIRRDRDSA